MSSLDDILGKKPDDNNGSNVTNKDNNAGTGAAAPAGATPANTAPVTPVYMSPPKGPNSGAMGAFAEEESKANNANVANTASVKGGGVVAPKYGPNNGAMGAFAEEEAKANAGKAAPNNAAGTSVPQGRYLTMEDVRKEIERQDKIMADNRSETPEEKEKREKRERRNKMFAALGDGISALSNLFFTTKGAPNMYNPNNSMTERQRAMYEQAAAAREKERAAYNAAASRRYEILTDADARAMKRDEAARQRAKDDADKERKNALAEAQAGKYKAQQGKDAAMTAFYTAKEQALLEGLPLQKALLVARAAKENAQADEARRRGTGSWVSGRGGGSGGSGKYTSVQIVDPATGKLVTVRVTGNKAAEILQGQSQDDSGHTRRETTDELTGSKKTTDTYKGQTAKQRNAEDTRKARQAAAARHQQAASRGGKIKTGVSWK